MYSSAFHSCLFTKAPKRKFNHLDWNLGATLQNGISRKGGRPMLITRKELQEVEVVADVVCNKCGRSCKDEATGVMEAVPFGRAWGYGSRKDGECHRSHVCERCYNEIVAGFKIPPEVHEYLLLDGCSCWKQ